MRSSWGVSRPATSIEPCPPLPSLFGPRPSRSRSTARPSARSSDRRGQKAQGPSLGPGLQALECQAAGGGVQAAGRRQAGRTLGGEQCGVRCEIERGQRALGAQVQVRGDQAHREAAQAQARLGRGRPQGVS